VQHNNITGAGIKVFPNPANDFVTVDFSSFTSVNGCQVIIESMLGQKVMQMPVNQSSLIIDLGAITEEGLYFVRMVDAQGNTLDVKKVILN
jgi:hypothetical protein